MDLPQIEEVKDVIATRKLTYVSNAGIREEALIEIGKPYELESDTYICPYRIGSNSYERIYYSVGFDSFQVLSFAMDTIRVELKHWLREKGGSFEFLDEPGTGLEE